MLVNSGAVSLTELWDDYGIVGDLIVSYSMCFTLGHLLLA